MAVQRLARHVAGRTSERQERPASRIVVEIVLVVVTPTGIEPVFQP